MRRTSLSRTCPALAMPFTSAISIAAPDQRVDQRQLVGDGREAVMLDERQGQRAGKRRLAGQEHALPGHEDVVEDGRRLHHLVPRADGVLDR